ncbi:MAG: tetratricopeptide repeat protein, partial [Ignavibacteria bacterium]|nr:tetratricopeptide repeat protein [Ignavibacteria bacterium]
GDSSMTDVEGNYNALKNDIANSFIDNYPFFYKISKLAEYYLTEKINYPRAILLLRIVSTIYPDDWRVYNNLAEAYVKNKQYQLALNNYSRSVELNPKNEEDKKQIEYVKKLIAK